MNLNTAHLILQAEDMDWEPFPDKETSFGDIRWKIFTGGEGSKTDDITFGACEISPAGGMKPHYHKLSEIYYILEGNGTVRLGRDCVSVTRGSIVCVPGDVVHGIENTGMDTLALIWMFPTGNWSEVKYQMV